jgi:hypothetical protein
VSEFPVAGLSQAGIEGVEHAGELEGFERQSEAGVVNGHDQGVQLVAALLLRRKPLSTWRFGITGRKSPGAYSRRAADTPGESSRM